jgi:hypothetical protein
LGLRAAAERLGVTAAEMTTAYRMSAEIADWLNRHARAHDLDAVELVGIRPTGVPVREVASGGRSAAEADLRTRWSNVTAIEAGDTWSHKGVEYDAVVVDPAGMTPSELYLAASRAAHELVVVG